MKVLFYFEELNRKSEGFRKYFLLSTEELLQKFLSEIQKCRGTSILLSPTYILSLFCNNHSISKFEYFNIDFVLRKRVLSKHVFLVKNFNINRNTLLPDERSNKAGLHLICFFKLQNILQQTVFQYCKQG